MSENNHQALVEEAIKLLKGKSDTKDGSDFIIDLDLESGNNQIVYAWVDLESKLASVETKGYIFIEADIGEYSDDIDFAVLLRDAKDFVFCRLYINEEEDDTIAVQSALPLNGLTPELLAVAIQEVALEADRFEDMITDE